MRTARTTFEFWDLRALNRTDPAEVMARLHHLLRKATSDLRSQNDLAESVGVRGQQGQN